MSVLLIGTVLLSPLTIWTLIVGPQWPFMVVMVGLFAIVTINALRSATPPSARIDELLSTWIALYVCAFAAMIVANVVHDGAMSLYVAVQATGLVGVVAMVTFPRWAHPTATATATATDGVASDALT